ncbi:diguanylate cyclase domain-containing protein [Geobacter sp. SVR]|uniref:sensor domain-containing diguanylate cyclase n=1 Tax=Geobacter sp. SVR TaxID=2495594 RepID=UPI00143EFA90|nr:diguanylate cyclase [Geobacter sp. SVR]BCS52808.1 diguanylate cyclase [Geobacter sp. SVR]GCF86674.1 diguanylate cyclase [Geobacter sp. SVR]
MEHFKDLSVLYVEDDANFRNWFTEVMRDRFGELRTAESGEQALAAYRERPCDLLITDLVMPGMDGLALCRAVRGYSMDMPIVITSASLSRTMLVESMNLGVDGYILKPVEMEMVESVLMQAVSRLRLRQQNTEAARFWQQTFDAVPYMIAVLDNNLRVLRLNRAARRQLGLRDRDPVGQDYDILICSGEDRFCRDVYRRALDTGNGYTSQAPVKMLDGYYHVTFSPLRDMHGNVFGGVHVAHNVTELKRTEDALRYTSTHDPLTGLYNRAWFETEFDRLSRSRTAPISVLIADVDGLKQVNDQAGHKAGDELLRRAATLLARCCRSGDGIARVGGDEFTVLLPGVGESDVEEMAARIRQTMSEGRQECGLEAVSLSLGVATAVDSAGLSAAIALADTRMYQDKGVRRPAPAE